VDVRALAAGMLYTDVVDGTTDPGTGNGHEHAILTVFHESSGAQAWRYDLGTNLHGFLTVG
jgi:hypothetical protein